ncbi:PH domain-containing protein [Nesterenkonia marinintestina]|uniref:PH domain-containing protein n=1 Tax=Nesterenkonia marinintestina TaxID=2979865 RepID=UPI0021BF686D|nr:PH domain-containing protein [Nesterenkonia sp. GX14115]
MTTPPDHGPQPEDPRQEDRRQEDAPAEAPEHDEARPSSEKWFDESWTKVHPLSPLVRGWLTLVAIPVIIFGYNWQTWADLWEVLRTGQAVDEFQRDPTPFLIGGGAFLLLVALIFGGFVLSWWFTRYKITDEHVMVKSGIFVRQHRQARIDRVQAVDLRQPLLARFTGLAELKFEVADGEGTAASLQFLKRSEAEELRQEIMDRAAGREAAQRQEQDPADHPEFGEAGEAGDDVAGPATTPDPERLIARVPLGRLIGSVVLGWGTLVVLALLVIGLLGVGVTMLGLALFLDEREFGAELTAVGGISAGAALPGMVPALVGLAFSYFQQINKGFRFTATMTRAGLRMRYGLLETTTQTVPPGRVQALQITQSPLWRPCGWYSVRVVVAGYGAGESRSTLLPVGKIEDVMSVTAAMFPDLRVEDPEDLFLEGLRGRWDRGRFTCGPKRARVFDPWVRRRRGFATTPSTTMFRDGRVVPRLTMMAHERIQSLSIEAGPLARRRRLARIHLHVPTGPFLVTVKNQDIDAVRGLFQYEAEHAAVARRFSDRNRWMLPEEQQQFEKLVTEDRAAAAEEPV